MSRRAHSAAVLAVSSFLLAACGGGGGSSPTPSGANATPTPIASGSGGSVSSSSTLSISPSGGIQVNAGQPTQQFVLSSTTAGLTAPSADQVSCGNLATVTGGGGTLPATYTVTTVAGANGSCTLVFDVGNNAIAYPIAVGTNNNASGYPATLTTTTQVVSFSGPSAPAQSVTVTAAGGTGQGTISIDSGSCSGIATVTGAGGAPPQSITVTPIGTGSCNAVLVDGSASLIVPISVGQSSTSATLSLAPGSVTFAAPTAGTQSVAVNYTGYVGQVTFNSSACAGIAGFSIANGSANGASGTLGTGTVTPLGAGSCSITFTSSSGATAALGVTVQ